MSRSGLSFPGRRTTTKLTAVAAAAAVALSIAGTAAPATSAPDEQCPTAKPVADLAAGEAVHGLTVDTGTTPEGFTGEVLGVLDDGIMPGLDMIMVRLTSEEIDRVGGIWSGMSGSPVYAEDGSLIGAVSYGLSFGPSPVAGVTPAAEMQALLDDPPPAPALRSPAKVAIPNRLGDKLVRQGDATAAEVDEGLAQLKLPFGLAGLAKSRVAQVAKKLKLDLTGLRLTGVNGTSALADTSMIAGGNVAAAVSYGDITAAGVGTVTAVCGDEILAFGHPMLWSGPSTLSLHPANTIYVQEDPVGAPFKLANVDPTPVGTITEDRMAAIKGMLGDVPDTGDITSTVGMAGGTPRDGETKVNLPDWMPDIAFSHILANQDRVFDGPGKGGADVDWSINGTREDGTPFTIRRGDVYASEYDITFESAVDVIEALYALEFNGIEDITIDSIDYDAELTRTYDHYVFRKAEIKKAGQWVKLTRDERVKLRPGRVATLKVTVESADSGVLRTTQRIRVPKSAEGRRGYLEVYGGNQYYSDFYPGGNATFDDVLTNLRNGPRNDDIVVNLSFYNKRGRVTDEVGKTHQTGKVVDGGKTYRVRTTG